MRQPGAAACSGGRPWRLQAWRTSTNVTSSYGNFKTSFALPWRSQSNLPSKQLCAVWDFLPPPHRLSLLPADSGVPSHSSQPSKPKAFPEDPFGTLTIFPPLGSWFPAHLQPAGSTAVSRCNEATDAVSPCRFADSRSKVCVQFISPVPPKQGCFLCIPKHTATA